MVLGVGVDFLFRSFYYDYFRKVISLAFFFSINVRDTRTLREYRLCDRTSNSLCHFLLCFHQLFLLRVNGNNYIILFSTEKSGAKCNRVQYFLNWCYKAGVCVYVYR